MRDNKERESKGSQIFSICVSSRWSQCNYAAAAAERDLICTTKGYLHRDLRKSPYFPYYVQD
jgi:hypothetical protein